MKGLPMRTILPLLVAISFVAAGCKNSDTNTTSSQSAGSASAIAAPEPSVVRVIADDKGYTPSSIAVQKGRPVTLRFVRTSDETCAREVTFPALGINKPLPLNSPIDIPVPTDTSKTYAFACGMNMFKGQLVVQ
jgi:plastocyanin domain-containing protein